MHKFYNLLLHAYNSNISPFAKNFIRSKQNFSEESCTHEHQCLKLEILELLLEDSSRGGDNAIGESRSWKGSRWVSQQVVGGGRLFYLQNNLRLLIKCSPQSSPDLTVACKIACQICSKVTCKILTLHLEICFSVVFIIVREHYIKFMQY